MKMLSRPGLAFPCNAIEVAVKLRYYYPVLLLKSGMVHTLVHSFPHIHCKLAVCQNLVPLVNIKIAGKWMFIPLKVVLIGIDPYPIEPLPNISADQSVPPPALIRGQRIARSRIFEAIVFVVLSSNAIWTGRPSGLG